MSGPQQLLSAAHAVLREYPPPQTAELLESPIFIVSAPRAGSNLLFELLSNNEGVWSIGGESHGIYRAFPHLRAENESLDSGSLGPRHADATTRELLPACYVALMRDHRQVPFMARPPIERPSTVTLFEKTPRNALNIPFLLETFPDSRYILLYRDPRGNIASILEAWRAGLRTGRFVTFRDLPGWDREAWCFLLPPGWRDMIGRSLAEIAAFQWRAANDAIIDALAALPDDRYVVLGYEELIDDPNGAVQRICDFADIEMTIRPARPLPLSRTSLTPPRPDKWREHEATIEALRPQFEPVWQRLAGLRGAAADTG